MSFTACMIISCLIAYLLGSVSTGILVSKATHGPDLRRVGSGNTGASNVQRTMGWKYGLITFFGDAAKGLIACMLAQLITGSHFGAMLAGLFVILGHNWPVFFQFKGGKGVATSGAVMLFCYPVPALICIALTILIIAVTKYISLGSLSLVFFFSLVVSLFYSGGNACIIIWTCLIAVLCFYRHRSNIVRLIKGTENKLGKRIG